MPIPALPLNARYIGRFAPSPTGPLHFGSLVAALASYLHARMHHGQWLVRMEDLDPPREQAGAADSILHSLEDHGLHWDQTVLYQSHRLDAYVEAVEHLRHRHLVYACDCTRQDLQAMGGIYNGRCRQRRVDAAAPHALRLKLYAETGEETCGFTDLIRGAQQQNLRTEAGDPIIKRKDGLFAYQLAVVVDDIAQGITHVIRGADLLEVTARQIVLFRLLDADAPVYGHLPLALTPDGQKLSKQNLAPPLQSRYASNNLWQALVFLGQNPPLELNACKPDEILAWGYANWDQQKLCRVQNHQAPPE